MKKLLFLAILITGCTGSSNDFDGIYKGNASYTYENVGNGSAPTSSFMPVEIWIEEDSNGEYVYFIDVITGSSNPLNDIAFQYLNNRGKVDFSFTDGNEYWDISIAVEDLELTFIADYESRYSSGDIAIKEHYDGVLDKQ